MKRMDVKSLIIKKYSQIKLYLGGDLLTYI